MTRDTERTVIVLNQVKVGDLFYCTPSEVRAWIRLSPAGNACRPTADVPVQRGGLSTHMNGMVQVWVRADHTDR